MLHSNRALAQELIDNIKDKFWDKEEDFLLEMYPPKPDTEKYSFLWGYGALFTMLATFVKLSRDKSRLPYLLKVAEKLELYRAKDGEYVHYNSHPDLFGAGEPYYDDNAWVVLGLIDMYEITGDKTYLTRAQAVTEYLYSGWSNGIGGIKWKEAECDTSNVCSCGPTAIASCKLYKLTGEKKYLDWAEKIYGWAREKLEDEDGTFFDSISEAGEVDKRKFSYNTGTMTECGVLLYGITGEDAYLENARRSADGAVKEFVRTTSGGKKTLPSMPWFNVYLIKGFVALNEYIDQTEFLSLTENILRNASYAGRTAERFYYPEWNAGDYTSGKYYHQGLDAFGTAECFSLLIPFEEKRRPVYCFLGSSVTYGCADTGKSFVDVLSDIQAFPCIKEAENGTTLCALGERSYVLRLREIDKRLKIEHLVVQLSTNDVSQNMPLGKVTDSGNFEDFDRNTTLGAIEDIIAYARKTWNCDVTFFTCMPYGNKRYENLIDKLYLLQRKWNIGILDFYRFKDMKPLDKRALSSFMADSIHPNALGYEWMGKVFCGYLQNTYNRKLWAT